MRPIYMDNHATTPIDPRVLDKMMPFLTDECGNPSSLAHAYGRRAQAAIDDARAAIAGFLGAASPTEIVFTSGATEANNLAVLGAVPSLKARGDHIVTSKLEHKAVLDPVRVLEREGFRATLIAPKADGVVDAVIVGDAMGDKTVFVSVMLANNEVGTVNAVHEIGALCRTRGVIFHCDAVAGAGRVPFVATDVDLASVSAHKMYGPKGIGALYVRAGCAELWPLHHGGGQERGLRPGTLNVPAIVGFGEAARIARAEMEVEAARILALRERMRAALVARVPHVYVHGSVERRLPGNLSIAFDFVEAKRLLALVENDVALSMGSACTAASLEPSHVLSALGIARDRAMSTIRICIGRFNSADDVDRVVALLVDRVSQLRGDNPSWRAIGG